jgi:hypothetical protein
MEACQETGIFTDPKTIRYKNTNPKETQTGETDQRNKNRLAKETKFVFWVGCCAQLGHGEIHEMDPC